MTIPSRPQFGGHDPLREPLLGLNKRSETSDASSESGNDLPAGNSAFAAKLGKDYVIISNHKTPLALATDTIIDPAVRRQAAIDIFHRTTVAAENADTDTIEKVLQRTLRYLPSNGNPEVATRNFKLASDNHDVKGMRKALKEGANPNRF